MSSDDDFQPTLYNKRFRKRRKMVNASKKIRTGDTGLELSEEPRIKLSDQARKNASVSTRTRAKTRVKNTETRGDITRTRGKNTGARGYKEHVSLNGKTTSVPVILPRLDLQPNTPYTINTSVRKTRQRLKSKESTKSLNLIIQARRQYQRTVLSLSHMDHVHTYSTDDVCCDGAVNERGKHNICDVIDSSEDESILIRGKPRRKKYKREEFTDSFHEAFYLSSSDESIINSSSDEDMFASSEDENKAKGRYPDDRQLRLIKRRTLKYYHTMSQSVHI